MIDLAPNHPAVEAARRALANDETNGCMIEQHEGNGMWTCLAHGVSADGPDMCWYVRDMPPIVLTAALPHLTANESEDPTVQTIENASLDDVRFGDHITWEEGRVYYGVTAFERHEGIAHHRDSYGDWCTEEYGQITRGEGEGITITIRRAVQDGEDAA